MNNTQYPSHIRAAKPRVVSCACALLLLVASLSGQLHAEQAAPTPMPAGNPDGFMVRLLEQAIANDPQLRSAYLDYQAEREETNISRSAMLPEINLGAAYRHERSDNIYTDPDSFYYDPNMPRSSGELDDTTWRLSISQRLIDWRVTAEHRRAGAQVNEAGHRLGHAEQTLIQRVTEALLTALYYSQQVHLNENRIYALDFKLRQVSRQYELGFGDQLDLLEVQSRLDMARSDLLQATSNQRDAITRVENITGQPLVIPPAWIAAAQRIRPQPIVHDAQSWIERIVHNREYLIIQSRVDQGRANLDASKAGYYPTLNLGLNHQQHKSQDDFRERTDSTISLDLNIPIYQGGRTSAQVRRASAKLQAEQARRDETLANIRQRTQLAHARLLSQIERLNALERSRQSAQRYLDAAERGQTLGMRSQLDVLDARNQLYDIQLQHAEALNSYLLADLELHFNVGELDHQRLAYYDAIFSQTEQPVE